MEVATAGRGVPTLPLADLLIYLCNHGAKHYWESLGWVADVAWLSARNPALDWRAVLTRADQLRSRRVLLVGLLVARDLLGAQVAAPMEQMMQADATAVVLARQAVRWLMNDAPGGALEKSWFLIRLHERPSDRLRCAYHLLATPNIADWEFVQLPRALNFLYPVVRLARLCRKQSAAQAES